MQEQFTLPSEKRCVRCFETKPADAFYVVRVKGQPEYLSARCRRCHNGGPAHPDYVPIITGRPAKPTRPSLIDRSCDICGTLYVARRNALARGQGTTCSRSCANSLRKIPEPDRFVALLAPPDTYGCRYWLAALGKSGYGRFTLDSGEQIEAHRYAYCLANGSIPSGLSVCHRCDVFHEPGDITYRRCAEASHLFLGTTQDNLEDRDAKRRQAKGERSGRAKLTDEAVRQIRRLRSAGLSQQAIADQFSVSQPVVSRVLRGAGWTHVL